MSDSLIAASIQMCSERYEKEKNWEKAEGLIRAAAKSGARLIALPELFNTGYYVSDKDAELAEQIPDGETCQRIEKLSEELNVWISGALIEKGGMKGTLFDTSVLIGPDGYVGKHRKVCLWQNEQIRFCEGNEYSVFNIGKVKVGMLICYESGFPEGARILALRGADIIIYNAAFGRKRSYAWDIATRARALENGLFVIAADMWAEEGDNPGFAGMSRIVGPQGDILAQCQDEDGYAAFELNLDQIQEQRQAIPYFRDYKQNLFGKNIVSQ